MENKQILIDELKKRHGDSPEIQELQRRYVQSEETHAPPPSSGQENEVITMEPVQPSSFQKWEMMSSGLNTPMNMEDRDLLRAYTLTANKPMFGEMNQKSFSELTRRGYDKDSIAYFGPPGQKTFGGAVVEEILPTSFGLGALAVTRNPYAIAGAAATGGAANELIREKWRQSYNPARTRTLSQLGKDISYSAAWEFVPELAGELTLGKAAAKAASPARKEILRGAKESADVLEAGYKKAIKQMPSEEAPLRSGAQIPQKTGLMGIGEVVARPLPSQQTASQTMQIIESLVSETFGAGSIKTVQKQMLPVAWKQASKDMADELTEVMYTKITKGEISATDVADIVADEIGGSRGAWRKLESHAHKRIDDLIAKTPDGPIASVDMTKAKSVANELLEKAKKKTKRNPKGGTLLPLKPEDEEYMKKIVNVLNNKLTFADAKDVNQQLSRISRQYKDAGNWNAKRIVDNINSEIESSMDIAAKQAGPKVVRAYDRAKKVSRLGHEMFDVQLVENLDKVIDYRAAGHQVVTKIFSGEGSVDSIKKILLTHAGKTSDQIAKNKETWKLLTDTYLAETLVRSRDVDGLIDPKLFRKQFEKIGQKALNGMYDPEKLKRINFFVDTGRIAMEAPEREKMFSFIVRSAQGAAVIGAITGDETELAIAALLTPALVSRFITSSTGNKLFTEGFEQVSKNAPLAAGYTGRLISALVRNKLEYEKEMERYEALAKKNASLERYRTYLEAPSSERAERLREAQKIGRLKNQDTGNRIF